MHVHHTDRAFARPHLARVQEDEAIVDRDIDVVVARRCAAQAGDGHSGSAGGCRREGRPRGERYLLRGRERSFIRARADEHQSRRTGEPWAPDRRKPGNQRPHRAPPEDAA